MQNIVNLVVFIFILGLIIFVHELGHFIAAKTFGIYAPEFSLGMGPKVFSKKFGETDYQLRLFPIGGFVVMAGEVDQEDNELMKDVPLERRLQGISPWKRCVIMLAGIFMNFVLAIVILCGVYSFAEVPSNEPIINTVIDGSQADLFDLRSGDVIESITIDEIIYDINTFDQLQSLLANSTQNIENPESLVIDVSIVRDGIVFSQTLTLPYNSDYNNFQIGITPGVQRLNFLEAVDVSIQQFKVSFMSIFDVLGNLVSDSSNTLNQLSGPAGIYSITAEITESGSIATLLCLVALLSINIGVFNLLPIPGLDGCHVLFTIVEKIIGKELPIKMKYVLQIAGLLLVFGLMIFVSINDIIKIFR